MNAFKNHQVKKESGKVATGGRCQFCVQILKLKKAQKAELYEAMLDKSIQTLTIVDVLESWDIRVGNTTVHDHRHGLKGFAPHMARLKEVAGK